MQGWQWLFLLEGIPAVLLGVVVLRYADRAAGGRDVADGGAARLVDNEISRDTSRTDPHRSVSATMRCPMVWSSAIPYFMILFSQLSVNFYLPTIIKDTLHMSNSRVGLLHRLDRRRRRTIGMLVNGWWSDRSGARIMHNVVPLVVVTCAHYIGRDGRESRPRGVRARAGDRRPQLHDACVLVPAVALPEQHRRGGRHRAHRTRSGISAASSVRT